MSAGRKALIRYRSRVTNRVIVQRGYLCWDKTFICHPSSAHLRIDVEYRTLYMHHGRYFGPGVVHESIVGHIMYLAVGWEDPVV